MLTATAAVLVGLGLLTYGADRFVIGASALARGLGVSPLIIGLTIVGFATSAPEMLVSATAAAEGKTSMAIGNALGSNVANIGLVLGMSALIKPLQVQSRILNREFPIMLAAMGLALLLMWNGTLDRLDGSILLGSLCLVTTLLVRMAMKSGATDMLAKEFELEMPEDLSTVRALFLIGLGLVLLLSGSQMLVWGAVYIATAWGVSELVIGLTIVAVGTSLPEVATSIVSVLKGEPDIAIGNVIGSNMFNTLGVLAVPALIMPGVVAKEILTRDFAVMLGITLLLFLMAYGVWGQRRINRVEGLLLLVCFCVYQWWLFASATN